MGITQQPAGGRLTAATFNSAPVVVSYLATGSVTNSNAETIIGTFTIAANDPTFPGGYWCYIHGTCTETATPNLTIRMRVTGLAGTIIGNSGTIATAVTPNQWDMLCWIGIEGIGTGGTFGNFSQTIIGGMTAPGLWQSEATAINTTVANTLVVTAQFSAASASNTATTKFGALYRL